MRGIISSAKTLAPVRSHFRNRVGSSQRIAGADHHRLVGQPLQVRSTSLPVRSETAHLQNHVGRKQLAPIGNQSSTLCRSSAGPESRRHPSPWLNQHFSSHLGKLGNIGGQ